MPGEMSDENVTQHEVRPSSPVTEMNGTAVNGHSDESSESHDTLHMDLSCGDDTKASKDRFKGHMDGFEIVTRNGSKEEEDRIEKLSVQSGEPENNDNGDTHLENGDSKDSLPIQEDEDKSVDSSTSGRQSAAPEEESMETDISREEEANKLDAEQEKMEEEPNDSAKYDMTESESTDKVKGVDESCEEKLNNVERQIADPNDSSTVAEAIVSPDKFDDVTGDDKAEEDEKDSLEKDDSIEKDSENDEEEGSKDLDKSKVSSAQGNVEEEAGPVVEPEINVAGPSTSGEGASKLSTADGEEKKIEVPKKKSKVDRMLENEKKQGSSASHGSDLRPFAKLLFELGLDLARQHVYKDLVKVQKKKRSHKLLNDKEEQQLDKLTEAYDHLVDKNDPYILDTQKCEYCHHHTDTSNAMALHKEFEHNGVCAICGFVAQNIYSFYFHMEAEHNRQGRVQPVMGMYTCPYCPYEHHSSKKNFLKHVQKCETHFKIEKNLQPVPADCDIPLKFPAGSQKAPPKAAPPAQKRYETRPVVPRPGPSVSTALPVQSKPAPAPSTSTPATATAPWAKDNQGPQLVQVGNQYFLMVQQNGQTFMTPMVGNATPQQLPGGSAQPPKPVSRPTATPPTPKVPAPTTQSASPQGKFEICEICGGFVKDRESLRIHFFWAHKVEIHPSVMKVNPGLKCQHCTQRCWTYQGYKRHLLVTHNTVKDSLQHMSCYVCTSPVADFITHMTSKHPQVVKHMLSQIRCVVCQDSFPSETALEAHMLVDHKNIVTKYGSLGTGGNPSASKSPSTSSSKNKAKPVPTGLYSNASSLKKCSRCAFQYSSPLAYKAHFIKSHSSETEPCPVCEEDINVGKPFIEHMAKMHLGKLVVSLKRMDPGKESSLMKGLETSRTSKKRSAEDEVIVIDLDTPKKRKLNTSSVAGKSDSNQVAGNKLRGDSKHKDDSVIVMDVKDGNSEKSKVDQTDAVVLEDDNEMDLETMMEADEESTMSKQAEDIDSEKENFESKSKAVVEEVLEIDGEKVVVQKMAD